MTFTYRLVLSLRFCGGLILDIKRKLPFFASDFYDALHIQSLSAILFIYLGTVTNAITFGGLLGDATDNMQVNIGVAFPSEQSMVLINSIHWLLLTGPSFGNMLPQNSVLEPTPYLQLSQK